MIKRTLVGSLIALIVVIGSNQIHNYNVERDRKDGIKKAISDMRRQRELTSDKISNARPKKWSIAYETDPASDKKIVKNVKLYSDDGFCYLVLENLLSGDVNDYIQCYSGSINRIEVEVKFDTDTFSRTLIGKFVSGYWNNRKIQIDGIGKQSEKSITTIRSHTSGMNLKTEFREKISQSEKMAIRVEGPYFPPDYFVKFSLGDSTEIISILQAR